MGLFGKVVKYNEIVCNLHSLGALIIKITPNISKDLLNNINLYAQKSIGKIFIYNTTIDNSYLYAYSLIAVGSYLNGRKLMKGNDWQQTIEYLKKGICKTTQVTSLDSEIKYLVQFEEDPLNQANRLINIFLDRNNLSSGFLPEEKNMVTNYMVPLIEFMALYIALRIDLIMDSSNVPKQRKLLFEYEQVANITYSINLEEYHEMLRLV